MNIPVLPLLFALALAFVHAPSLFGETPSPEEPLWAARPPRFVPLLEVGSPAPALNPEKWIRGPEVAAFEKDKVYVVECWATWCPPCVASIPHMNALHQKFNDKGLVVIGVNVMETPDSKAAGFVEKKGAGMAYRVAYDGGDSGPVVKKWLEAAGVAGIPHAFVVRENRILWHGHPAKLSEELIETMLAGKYDLAASIAAVAKERVESREKLAALRGEFQRCLREKKLKEAEDLLGRVMDAAERIDLTTSAFLAHDGIYELSLAGGDAAGAANAAREFALAGRMTANAAAFQRDAVMRIVADPRLAGVRDHAFALECADLIAAKSGAATSLDMLARARLLDATGKTSAALAALESLVAAKPADLPPEAAGALAALKSGKPWPKDRFNPDAKADPAPAAAGK